MYKEIILASCCIAFSAAAQADICPSVKEIKSGHTKHWKAYDSDNDKPLSNIRTARFRRDISKFSIAEWSNVKHNNAIHCYYSNDDGSTLEAYFAKDHYLPNKQSRYWYRVTGMMQCAAGADRCDFAPDKKRLAEKESTKVSL